MDSNEEEEQREKDKEIGFSPWHLMLRNTYKFLE